MNSLNQNNANLSEGNFMNMEELEKTDPKLYQELKNKFSAEGAASVDVDASVTADRTRATTIKNMAFDGQEKLVETLINSGASVEAAAKAINENEQLSRKAMAKAQLESGIDPLDVTKNQSTENSQTTTKTEPKTLKEKWDADVSLRKDFSCFEAYLE